MSDQELINAAKAPTVAYNNKNWNAFKAAVTPKLVYDEVGTGRKIEGSANVIEALQGWAKAIPDSKATFEGALASDGKVVLELTWRGKHTGPMQMPNGEIPATGKSIEIRACQVLEIEGGKVKSMRHYFDMMTMMQQLGLAGR